MKRFFLSLLLMYLAAAGNFVSAQEEQTVPSAIPNLTAEKINSNKLFADDGAQVVIRQEDRGAKAQKETWALLIGYSIFEKDEVKLPEYSQNDVAQMAAAMKETGVPAENIIVMTSAAKEFYLQPTRKNILTMLRLLAENAKAKDSIWVMFSGIGAAIDQESCFLPKGTILGKADGWIGLSEVREILSQGKSQNSTVLWLANRQVVTHLTSEDLAAAQNTAAKQGVSEKGGAEPEALGKEDAGSNRTGSVFYSCALGTYAMESQEAELDLFLSEFLAAVKASPEHFASNKAELFEKARAAVMEKTAKKGDGAQSPVLEIWEIF